jgi:hypothetical protein
MKIITISFGIVAFFVVLVFYLLLMLGIIPKEYSSFGVLLVISIFIGFTGFSILKFRQRVIDWVGKNTTPTAHDFRKMMGYTEKQIQEDLLSDIKGKRNKVILTILGLVLLLIAISSLSSITVRIILNLVQY